MFLLSPSEGKAHIQRPGKDITIVAYSIAVNISMDAASQLAQQDGIQAEVKFWNFIKNNLKNKFF
jgi:pyruvate/2-oxoglutarate/acetoin dehydrogenase E1 component